MNLRCNSLKIISLGIVVSTIPIGMALPNHKHPVKESAVVLNASAPSLDDRVLTIRVTRNYRREVLKKKAVIQPKPRPVGNSHIHSPVHRASTQPVRTVKHVVTISGSATAWAHQAFSIRVANCESGGGPSDHHTYYDGNPHLYDPNGHYGKWQFAPSTWYRVGGTGNAADASEAEQDYRAWLLWKRDGWGQWECAHLV